MNGALTHVICSKANNGAGKIGGGEGGGEED